MLIKTPQFNKKFLTDLASIVVFSKEYRDELKRSQDNLEVGYKNQISKKVKFVGSYTTKKYGDYLTDIDVVQLVYWDEKVVTRLSQIMQNLDNSNFIFIRFYCGYIEEIAIPWVLDGNGSCRFTLSDLDNWVGVIKNYIPSTAYEKILKIYNQKSLSFKDIMDIESLVEPYLSLVWTKQDIINGYKIFGGKRYNLLDMLQKYPRKKVIKYMYRYSLYEPESKTFRNEYCLVDVALKKKLFGLQVKTSDDIELKAYYERDTFKMIKYMKKYLPEQVRSIDHTQAVRSKISKYTPLAGRIELIEKCKKYNVISQGELDNLLLDAKKYAITHDIPTLDYNELQKIIYDKTKDVYSMFRDRIEPQFERLFTLFEIRGEEGNIKIPKKVIQDRLIKGVQCVFFPIDIKDMNNLITVALNAKLDPKKLLKCVYDSCEKLQLDIHTEIKKMFVHCSEEYKVKDDSEGYQLFHKDQVIAKSKDVRPLQIIALVGLK
jgi:hypothetical protein